MKENKEKNTSLWGIVGIAWDLGWLIAIPLVGFAIGGRFLDKILSSSPLFTLAGILIAIILSTIMVYRKTTELLKDVEDTEKKDEDADSN